MQRADPLARNWRRGARLLAVKRVLASKGYRLEFHSTVGCPLFYAIVHATPLYSAGCVRNTCVSLLELERLASIIQ
jgi:hypothetical protein